ncbi:MAG: D-alanyl-D-alanine carboxypeptidase family protein [Clostridiaceae bacterium]
MRRLTSILIALIMLLSIPSGDVSASGAPGVSADSAILMDAGTGEILYEKNIGTSYPPASTTKIMTALLTLENCKLDDVVTIGKKPPYADGSKLYLFEGEQIKVKDLLYGLILASANDCAEALAEHISGSVEEFAVLMNKRAKELGCTSTNFINPSGLYDPNHKTSSRDLALIMKELAKQKDYPEIATTGAYKMAPTNKNELIRPLWNENKLIQQYSEYYYPYCFGGKTGYTVQSQHSYVAVAEKDGRRLIVALVHDCNKTFFRDAINLFEYGFNLEKMTIFSKGEIVTNYTKGKTKIPLIAAENFYYYGESGSDPNFDLKLNNDNLSLKPFSKGDEVTSVDISRNGVVVGTLKLSGGVDHGLFRVITGNIFLSVFSVIFVLVTVPFGLRIYVVSRRRKIKRRLKIKHQNRYKKYDGS